MARRFLSRLAWYFGIAWGDPGEDRASPAPASPVWWRVVAGWLAAAAVFAFLSEAADGFDGAVLGSVAKGVAFATVMLAFTALLAHHAAADGNGSPAPDRSRDEDSPSPV